MVQRIWAVWFMVAFAVGFVFPGALRARADTGQVIKVLSLNFNDESVPDDLSGSLRDARFAALVDWVHQNDPDVILIQEGWKYRSDVSVAKALARTLDFDQTYWIGMGFPGVLYDSNAILAKKKFRMGDTHRFKLPHSSLYFGDGQNWALIFGPVTWALGAQLFLDSGEPIWVYNTHLVGADSSERYDQTVALDRRINDRLRKRGFDPSTTKVILGGDLNSDEDTDPIRFLRANGYQDTWRLAHPGDPGMTDCSDPTLPYFDPMTLGANQFPNQSGETGDHREDYVFLHGPGQQTLASTLVFTSTYEKIWMSDHFAVFSVIGENGAVAPGIPNPDRDHSGDSSLPAFQEVTPDLFLSPRLPDLDVSNPHGLAIVNRLNDYRLHFLVEGPGVVLTSPEGDLGPDEAASFFFEQDGDYQLFLESSGGGSVGATIHVRTGAAKN